MIKSNGDFIHNGCECCGKQDLIASEVILKFNYGSENDGDMITLAICGNCADDIYKFIEHKTEKHIGHLFHKIHKKTKR